MILGPGPGQFMVSLEHFCGPRKSAGLGEGRNRTCQKNTGASLIELPVAKAEPTQAIKEIINTTALQHPKVK